MDLLDLQDPKAVWESLAHEEILENQEKKVLQVRSESFQEIQDRKDRRVYLETPDLKAWLDLLVIQDLSA